MKRNHKKGYAILGGLFALCLGCGGIVNAFSDDDAAAPVAGQTETQQPARAADLPTTSATQAPASPPALSSPAARITATTTRPATTRPTLRATRTTTATRRPTVRRTTTTPKPRRATEEPREVYYANCSAVRAAGADPIRRGDPGYSRKLDRDGDGVACE
jgi:hypothetical protein